MRTGLFNTIETLMVAVTFAGQNQHEYAIELLNSAKKKEDAPTLKKEIPRPDNRPRMSL